MEREIVRRRHLPHWDVPGATYFVTTCLEESIPAQGLLELARYRNELGKRPKPRDMTEEAWKVHCWKLGFAKMEGWLDRQPGRRDLDDPALARVIVDSMFHFAGERYALFSYVVMPSHFHWLFRPLPQWVETLTDDGTDDARTPRERITYSLNRFTATRCNRLLNVKGQYWQTESYDHWVRDVEEMERIMRYIEENPVKAGLVRAPELWLFSSAWARKQAGTEWGTPLGKGMPGLE